MKAASTSGYNDALIEGISTYRSNHVEVDINIHEAASRNDIAIMEDILVTFPKAVCSVDTEGRTALHIACLKGKESLDAVKLLIQYECNVNAQDADGQTALHLCSDPILIRLLCSNNANPNIQDNNRFTPLHVQVMLGHLGVVQYLLIHSADPRLTDLRRNRNALHYAATTGSFSLFSALLQDTQVPISNNLDDQDSDGNTVMHLLAATRADIHKGLVEMTTEGLLPPQLVLQKSLILLLDRGASANIRNKVGRSPLHYICASQSLRINLATAPFVDLLLGIHANPNITDKDGCTPLMVAVVFGDYEVTTLLVSAGGDLNAPCSLTSPYLHNPNGILAENGMMDNEGRSPDDDVSKLVEPAATCTPSDIIPCTNEILMKLFSAISSVQTKIPMLSGGRLRCMHCKKRLLQAPPPPPIIRNITTSNNNNMNNNSNSSSSSIPISLSAMSNPLDVLKPGPKVSALLQSIGININMGGLTKVPTHSNSNSNISESNDISCTSTSTLVESIKFDNDSYSYTPKPLILPSLLCTISPKGVFNNCAHCNRLLCRECLPSSLLSCFMPSFLQHKEGGIDGNNGSNSVSVPLCEICAHILIKSMDIIS